MDAPKETPQLKPTKPLHHTRKHYLISAALVLAAVAVTAFIYNRQLTSLQAKLTSTTAANKTLSDDKAKLAAKNKKLSTAAKALQLQESVSDSDDATETPTVSEPKTTTKPVTVTTAAGELTVVKFKKTSITEFANPTENPMPTGDVYALYVIIKNTSGATQQYNTHDFTAITNNGEAIKSRMYGASAQKAWYYSELITGGSKEVALLYGTDQNIVSLEWKAPGGTETITVPVPAVEE